MPDLLFPVPSSETHNLETILESCTNSDLVYNLRKEFARVYAAGYTAGKLQGLIESRNDTRRAVGVKSA